MEKIELRVELCAGESIEKPWSAVFGLAGGTIGRGGQNKLILPDSDAAIARVHAMVRLGADTAYLANLCERRLIQVDDVVVRPGQEVTLPLGARINIGPYSIGVYTLNAASAPATLAAKVSAAVPASTQLPGYAPKPSTVPPRKQCLPAHSSSRMTSILSRLSHALYRRTNGEDYKNRA